MAGLRAKVVLSVDTAQAKRSTERAAAEMNRVMGGVGKRQVNFNVNSKSFTQPLGRITGSANEFTKSLEASNARVIAFGASVGIINAISDAFKNLVGETVRFQKTLTDINVVLNQSNSAMQQFGQGLFDVARNTAQSFNVASEAALEFSRQGLTMEEVLKRTNDALTLTRLTGLKAAEAVSGLTAAVNAFSSVGLTTTQVIDKLAAVDVKFAVSSEDLINALERTGAVAIDAGVELDSLIGLVTSLQQTTARGGAVIGNGLKTIFTRIQRPAALSQIEDLDISVRNLSGAILPADKILINIAKSFDRLTSSQKSNIVQFSAGIFQANVFRASLRDLAKDQSIQSRATEVSASAAGDAALKNQQLNKTISALASQTGSDIQELAALLGELMVKPELGSYLETFRDVIGGIKNMLGGGEDEGNTFAKGLVAGIGNIITGPAFIAFGAIFIKLFMNIAKFAKGSMKDVMNIVDRKTKVEQIEKSIVDTLAKNKDIQTSLNNLEGDREAQSKFILKVIEAQTNAMREQEKLASRLARPLLDAGVKSDLTVSGNGRVDLDGDGRTDSFGAGGVVPQSARKERKEASRGGYSAGAVDSMSIKGLGRVVYNKAETVKQFPGMQQPAIMPPQKSRAGSKYKDAFSTKHGFDPYASGGFVPNFATLNGDALRLNQSKMHLYANPREAKPGGDAVRNAMMELVNSGKPVTVRAATDNLLKGEGGSHTKAIKGLIRFIADQENGPKLFERDFKLTNLPWKGNKGEDASEDAVAKALNKGGNKYINTGKRPGAHGDKTFPVDLIGEGLDPVEVKSGEWQQPNILLKSMRLYSDDELMQFAERQYGATPEMLTGARMENLGKSARLLQGKGLLDKDASLEDQHNAALKYGIAGGFVPNYLNQTDQGKDEEWKSIAGWLKKQATAEVTVRRSHSFEAMKDAGVLVGAKNSRSMESKWSRLLGPSEKPENRSVQESALNALGKPGYDDLIGNANKVLPPAPRGGSIPPTGPPSSLPQLVWGRGRNLTRKASLGDIMGRPGAVSLNQLNGLGSSPGAAFRGTNFGETNFNNLASTWEGRGDLSALASTSYTAGITPWHPYRLNEDGTEGPPISQHDLKRAGIDDQDFEALIAKDPRFGTGTASQAPLDFTGPNGEAKLVSGFDTTSKNLQGNPGGFYWSQIIGKILRSNIGNSGLSSKTKAQDFKDMWSAPGTLSTNLFVPELASGLVPNFADDRNRQQKISDVLGDPSNAGINFKGGKPRSIKSKNMFQKTWLESYFKTGLEGDYQMLMKMGYDPDQLLDLRAYSKKGGDVNVLGKGLVPNFAGDTTLYRGTSPKYQKGSPDRPNAPQFLFDKLLNAKTKAEFMTAVEELGIQHSQGQYSGSYNADLKPATLEQIRGPNVLGAGEVQHAGYVYKRPTKGGRPRYASDGTTMPSGFVSKTKDHDVADRFSRAIEFQHTSNHNLQGQIHEDQVPNSRILNEEALGKIVDRVGLGSVQKGFKRMMKKGTLKALYLDLDKWKPKTEEGERRRSYDDDHNYRSIGQSGEGMTFNEQEVVQIWDKHSPYYGGAGVIPNFANPLKDAVSRERQAGIPESKIRVEKSKQLRGPGNPMGLAVTNTRDEPLGVGQGIRRARSMGIDPRKHGAASGVVPNFAAPDELELPDEVFNALIEDAEKLEKAMGEELTSAVGEATEALKTMGNTGVTPSENRKATEQAINDQSAKLKAEKGKDPADQNKEAIKDGESIIEHLKGILGAIKEKEGAVGETAKVKKAGQKITKSDANIEQIDTVINRIINKNIKEVGDTPKGLGSTDLIKATEEIQKFKNTLEESEGVIKDEKQERGEGLQKLFYMQSAISMANGFLEQFAEGARGGAAALVGVAQAASNVTAAYIQQKELIGEGMNMLGVGEKEKGYSLIGGGSWAEQRAKGAATELEISKKAGGKKGGVMGQLSKLGRGFGRFLPVLGQLYTGFTGINEIFKGFNIGEALFGLEKGAGIMDIFSGQSARAAKKIEKLGESAEKLESSLEALQSQAQNNEEVEELEALGARRTQSEELKLQKLRLKGLDLDLQAQKGLAALTNENLVGSKIAEKFTDSLDRGTMSNEEYIKMLNDLLIAQKKSMVSVEISKGLSDAFDSRGINDYFFSATGSEKDFVNLASKGAGSQLGVALARESAGGVDLDVMERLKILGGNLKAYEAARGAGVGDIGGISNMGKALERDFVGTDSFDSQQVAQSISVFAHAIDGAVVNINGMNDFEAKAFNDGMGALISQVKIFKKNLEGLAGSKKEAQLKAEYITAYKDLLFQIDETRSQAAHGNKIEAETLKRIQSRIKSEEDLLIEYSGLSREVGAQLENERKKTDAQQKYSHELDAIQAKNVEALGKVSEEYITTGKLASDFNKKGADGALEGVENLKNAIANIDINFVDIGKSLDIKIDPKTIDQLEEDFKGLAGETKGLVNNQQIVTKIMDRYGKSMNAVQSGAFLMALDQMEMISLSDDNVNLIKKTIAEQKRALDLAKKKNDTTKEELQTTYETDLVSKQTLAGAKELKGRLEGGAAFADSLMTNLEGEAATLKVINDFEERRAQIILKSVGFAEKQVETQKQKNRTEMDSSLASLRQVEAQEKHLHLTEDSLIIQEAKLKTEGVNASLAAKEAEARYKFLTKESHRGKLVDAQIKSEMFGLRTDAMLNRDKLKRKIIGGQLKEQAELELKEQTTATSSEALKTAQLAVNLNHLRRAGSLSDDANRLLEKSNKLIEAQNAARQASMSRGDLAFNTRANLNTEQAGAIGETRGAAMRSIMTNSPEDALAFASSLEETNKQINNGTRAVDRLRTRMTELDVSAKNLGADLVELGFDGVRSGFKQLLNDIGSGAKSAGDAWRDFGLGLAKTLLDRLTDHNIDRIVKDLTFAFTGVEVKSEAEKIASSNNHLIDHLGGLTKSNVDLGREVDNLATQLGRGIALLPPPKEVNDAPRIPDIDPNAHGLGGRAGATLPTRPGAGRPGATQGGTTPPSWSPKNTPGGGGFGVLSKYNLVPSDKYYESFFGDAQLPPNDMLLGLKKQELGRAQDEFKKAKLANEALRDDPNRPREFTRGGVEISPDIKASQNDRDLKALGEARARESRLEEEIDALKGHDYSKGAPSGFTNKEGVLRSSNLDNGAERGLVKDTVELNKRRTEEGITIVKLGEKTEAFAREAKEAEINLKTSAAAVDKLTAAVDALQRKANAASLEMEALLGGTAVTTGPNKKQGGGRIQHFADGGYVKGPGGKDKVPAMLTAGEFVVPKKEMDNVQKYNGGTPEKGAEEKPKGRAQRGVEGVAGLWASIEAARFAEKILSEDTDKPPTFNMKKLDTLSLGSDVNFKRGDPRLSAKFLARDPVMQEYRDYLMETANYKTQKTNEDFRETMSTFSSVLSAATSFVAAELVAVAAPYIQKGISKTTDYFKGDLGLGKHSDAYRDLKDRGFDASYSDVRESIEKGTDLEIYRGTVKYSFSPYNKNSSAAGADNHPNALKFSHRKETHRPWEGPVRPRSSPTPANLGDYADWDQQFGLKNKAKGRQGGGSIPAMLTAGEGYIPAPVAKRIGYNNLSHMNNTGSMPIVKGTGGVDNVGPVGLNSGDFIMKKSSTNKLLRDNPNAMRFSLQGQSDGRKGAQGYYEGGVVGSELTVPARSLGPQKSQQGNRLGLLDQKESEKSDSSTAGSTTNAETTNNININISIDKAGAEVESEEGGEDSYEKERNLSMKIKGAVLEVIREEKRIGGELS